MFSWEKFAPLPELGSFRKTGQELCDERNYARRACSYEAGSSMHSFNTARPSSVRWTKLLTELGRIKQKKKERTVVKVNVEERTVGEIEVGLLVFLGVGHSDSEKYC